MIEQRERPATTADETLHLSILEDATHGISLSTSSDEEALRDDDVQAAHRQEKAAGELRLVPCSSSPCEATKREACSDASAAAAATAAIDDADAISTTSGSVSDLLSDDSDALSTPSSSDVATTSSSSLPSSSSVGDGPHGEPTAQQPTRTSPRRRRRHAASSLPFASSSSSSSSAAAVPRVFFGTPSRAEHERRARYEAKVRERRILRRDSLELARRKTLTSDDVAQMRAEAQGGEAEAEAEAKEEAEAETEQQQQPPLGSDSVAPPTSASGKPMGDKEERELTDGATSVSIVATEDNQMEGVVPVAADDPDAVEAPTAMRSDEKDGAGVVAPLDASPQLAASLPSVGPDSSVRPADGVNPTSAAPAVVRAPAEERTEDDASYQTEESADEADVAPSSETADLQQDAQAQSTSAAAEHGADSTTTTTTVRASGRLDELPIEQVEMAPALALPENAQRADEGAGAPSCVADAESAWSTNDEAQTRSPEPQGAMATIESPSTSRTPKATQPEVVARPEGAEAETEAPSTPNPPAAIRRLPRPSLASQSSSFDYDASPGLGRTASGIFMLTPRNDLLDRFHVMESPLSGRPSQSSPPRRRRSARLSERLQVEAKATGDGVKPSPSARHSSPRKPPASCQKSPAAVSQALHAWAEGKLATTPHSPGKGSQRVLQDSHHANIVSARLADDSPSMDRERATAEATPPSPLEKLPLLQTSPLRSPERAKGPGAGSGGDAGPVKARRVPSPAKSPPKSDPIAYSSTGARRVPASLGAAAGRSARQATRIAGPSARLAAMKDRRMVAPGSLGPASSSLPNKGPTARPAAEAHRSSSPDESRRPPTQSVPTAGVRQASSAIASTSSLAPKGASVRGSAPAIATRPAGSAALRSATTSKLRKPVGVSTAVTSSRLPKPTKPAAPPSATASTNAAHASRLPTLSTAASSLRDPKRSLANLKASEAPGIERRAGVVGEAKHVVPPAAAAKDERTEKLEGAAARAAPKSGQSRAASQLRQPSVRNNAPVAMKPARPAGVATSAARRPPEAAPRTAGRQEKPSRLAGSTPVSELTDSDPAEPLAASEPLARANDGGGGAAPQASGLRAPAPSPISSKVVEKHVLGAEGQEHQQLQPEKHKQRDGSKSPSGPLLDQVPQVEGEEVRSEPSPPEAPGSRTTEVGPGLPSKDEPSRPDAASRSSPTNCPGSDGSEGEDAPLLRGRQAPSAPLGPSASTLPALSASAQPSRPALQRPKDPRLASSVPASRVWDSPKRKASAPDEAAMSLFGSSPSKPSVEGALNAPTSLPATRPQPQLTLQPFATKAAPLQFSAGVGRARRVLAGSEDAEVATVRSSTPAAPSSPMSSLRAPVKPPTVVARPAVNTDHSDATHLRGGSAAPVSRSTGEPRAGEAEAGAGERRGAWRGTDASVSPMKATRRALQHRPAAVEESDEDRRIANLLAQPAKSLRPRVLPAKNLPAAPSGGSAVALLSSGASTEGATAATATTLPPMTTPSTMQVTPDVALVSSAAPPFPSAATVARHATAAAPTATRVRPVRAAAVAAVSASGVMGSLLGRAAGASRSVSGAPGLNLVGPNGHGHASLLDSRLTSSEMTRLTTRNTRRNEVYCVKLDVQTVRVEGPRPPSPTPKVRALSPATSTTTTTATAAHKEAAAEARHMRAKRRSGDAEGDEDGPDENQREVDSATTDGVGITLHVLGAGEEDRYATPPRTTRGGVVLQAPRRQVRWHKALITGPAHHQSAAAAAAAEEKRTHPSYARSGGPAPRKGCLSAKVARWPLDSYGNCVEEVPLSPRLRKTRVVVRRVIYDGEE